ncbi:hypothetical protein VE04_07961 [Pseudogymnoascus sp. 24MN13]|nr:hypothetical protein VE04_07961 [Pseudogymnoascus sp. 24MN13]
MKLHRRLATQQAIDLPVSNYYFASKKPILDESQEIHKEVTNTVLQDVRIRNNQRTSRANRKAHLDNLERRLQKYQLEGVEISPEIWVAASKVLKENQRLRQKICQDETLKETLNEMLRKEGELAFEDRMIYDEDDSQQDYSLNNLPSQSQILSNEEALQQVSGDLPNETLGKEGELAFGDCMMYPELETPYGKEASQQVYSINYLPSQLQILSNEEALQQDYSNFPSQLQICDDYNINNLPAQLQTLCDEEALQQDYSINNFPPQLQMSGDYNIDILYARLQTLCDEETLRRTTAASLFSTTNSEFRNLESDRISVDSQNDDPAFIEKIREEIDQWMTYVTTAMGRTKGMELATTAI